MKLLFFHLSATALLVAVTAKPDSRIIGGTPARAGQFPYAAAIQVQTKDSTFFCSGAFVRWQWIFTSGHCVYNATLFTIQLGSVYLKEEDPNRVTLATSEYFIHPDFNPNTIEHDVGLIKLRMQISSNEYVHIIGFNTLPVADDTPLIVYGWGQISDSDPELSEHLQYAEVVALSNEDCKLVYGDQIKDNMLCVEGNYNEGTCTGDTGSPVLSKSGNTLFIAGVSSFIGTGGCESTNPSGFTRVDEYYYSWISPTMKANS